MIFSIIMQITNKEVHEKIVSFKAVKSLKGVVTPLLNLNQINQLLREKGLTIEIPKYGCTYL